MGFKNRYKNNIKKLYAYWFFHNLIFAYVIERLYWEMKGITVQQVIYTEIIYASGVVLLELPTGSLADFWSRKGMMILSAIFTLFEFLILIFAHNFWHFGAAVFVAAIGKALSSGTSNALFYDSLKLAGQENRFEEVIGKNNFVDRFSGLIAALIGSVVAWKCSYATNYWLSLVSVLISLIIALTLVEPVVKTAADTDKKYVDYIKEAYKFLRGKASIKFVIMFGVILSACLTYVDEFWQLYIKELKIPVLFFGVVSAANSLMFSTASIFAHRVKKWLSYKAIFSIVAVLFSAALVISSFINSKTGLLFLLAVYAASGIIEPLV